MQQQALGIFSIKTYKQKNELECMLYITNFRFFIFQNKDKLADLKKKLFDFHFYELKSIDSSDSLHIEFKFANRLIVIYSTKSNEILLLLIKQLTQLTRGFTNNQTPKIIILPRKRSEEFVPLIQDIKKQLEQDWKNNVDNKYYGNSFLVLYRAFCEYFSVEPNNGILLSFQKFFKMEKYSPKTFKLSSIDNIQADPKSNQFIDLRPLFSALAYSDWFIKVDVSGVHRRELFGLISHVVSLNQNIQFLIIKNIGFLDSFSSFTNSLNINTNIPLNTLDLSNNPLGDKLAKKLIQGLVVLKHGVKELKLSNCQINSKGLQNFFSTIINSPSITRSLMKLDISKNNLGKNGSKAICSWLKAIKLQQNKLEFLNLADTSLVPNDFLNILKNSYTRFLKYLNIKGSVLDSKTGNALCEFVKKSSCLEYLNITNTLIPLDILQALFTSINTNNYLKELFLIACENNLKIKGAEIISNNIKGKNKIKSLIIDDNNFRAEGMILIFEGLISNKSIKNLSVGKNLKKKEKLENLALVLQKFIQQNTTVQHLNLSQGVKNSGIKHGLYRFLESLKNNTSLKSLNISFNEISNSGLELIGEIFLNNNTLNSLIIDDVKGNIELDAYKCMVEKLTKNNYIYIFPIPFNIIKKLSKKKNLEQLEELTQTINYIITKNQNRAKSQNLKKDSSNVQKNNIKKNILNYQEKRKTKKEYFDENFLNQLGFAIHNERIKSADSQNVDLVNHLKNKSSLLRNKRYTSNTNRTNTSRTNNNNSSSSNNNNNNKNKNNNSGSSNNNNNNNINNKTTKITTTKTTLNNSNNDITNKIRNMNTKKKETSSLIRNKINLLEISLNKPLPKKKKKILENNVKKSIPNNLFKKTDNLFYQGNLIKKNNEKDDFLTPLLKNRKSSLLDYSNLKFTEMDDYFIKILNNNDTNEIKKLFNNTEKNKKKQFSILMIDPNSGYSIFHYCCTHGNPGLLSFLLKKKYANQVIQLSDKMGMTPLHKLVENSPNRESIMILSDYQIDFNITENRGWNALQLYFHELNKQNKKPSLEIVMALIDNNSNPNLYDNEQSTSVHFVAKFGFLNSLKYLLQNGGQVNIRNNKYQTPLHLASKFGHIKCVQRLLEHGSRINRIDINGNTPISVAKNNQISIFLKIELKKNMNIKWGHDANFIRSYYEINNQINGYYEFTILLLGEMECGKTTMINKFRNLPDSFIYFPTIEKRDQIGVIIDGYKVLITLLDVSGDNIYSDYVENWIQEADGFILCYSITDQVIIFKNLSLNLQKILKLKKNLWNDKAEDIPQIIVSLKNDLKDKQIIQEINAKKLADQFHCPFLSVSSKSDYNVELAFNSILNKLKTKIPQMKPKNDNLFSQKIDSLINSQKELKNYARKIFDSKLEKSAIKNLKLTFENIINSPICFSNFANFLQSDYCEENLIFYTIAKQFQNLNKNFHKFILNSAIKIKDNFIIESSKTQINIDYYQREEIENLFKDEKNINTEIFDEALISVIMMLTNDSYPKFLKSDFYNTLIKQLI
ncbi:leucine-rich repeat isoform f [Anaeramoeba flamelloides]|uniref:Leucine-rich repeat isoform f n=1 Tax=Anaeramoeba flamelloides TaxID=1746091 RepID=A0AAV7YIA0_9EUKA|nr:leucine-rich repeat isoform f [Anaeramoeba flamelloides]